MGRLLTSSGDILATSRPLTSNYFENTKGLILRFLLSIVLKNKRNGIGNHEKQNVHDFEKHVNLD